jgi:hypothetical protein
LIAKTGRRLKSALLNAGLESANTLSTETGANSELAGAIGCGGPAKKT